MNKFLALITKRKKASQMQELKRRVLKNREGILDVMSENMGKTRQCPFLLGQKCIGEMCEHFIQFVSIEPNGEKLKYYRCVHVQTPLLIIELNENIRKLTAILNKE